MYVVCPQSRNYIEGNLLQTSFYFSYTVTVLCEMLYEHTVTSFHKTNYIKIFDNYEKNEKINESISL